MDFVPLSAAARATGIKAKALRRTGRVPCIVYGNKTPNTTLDCEEVALKKAYIKAGANTLVELAMDEKKVPVLFHQVAFDPVSDRMIHVDFYAVDMSKELEAPVPIRFEGESLAVKEGGGILVTPVTTVDVRCLPTDLPKDLPVSLDSLAELHTVITVANLVAPKGVTILTAPETVIATVQEARKEEEVVAPIAAAVEGAGTAGAEGAVPTAAEDAGKKEEKGKKE